MSNIAEKMVELLTFGQNAFSGADILSLKNRFLFALKDHPRPPKELCDYLKQDKTNIAHLAAALTQDELIEKCFYAGDKRRVRYCLSEKGRGRLKAALAESETRFQNFLDSPEALADAEAKLDEVIRLLSFL